MCEEEDGTDEVCMISDDEALAVIEARHAHKDEAMDRVLELARRYLRGERRLPKGCYCTSRCWAPRPEWCRDFQKRDALAAWL